MIRQITPLLGVEFMNLGYWPIRTEVIDEEYMEDEEIEHIIKNYSKETLSESKTAHLFIYEKTLAQHEQYPDFENIDLLEVGCGLGNGLKWIIR